MRIKKNFKDDYSLKHPTAVAVLAINSMVVMISTRKTSLFNWKASAITIALIICVIIASIAHVDATHLTRFLPYVIEGY
ncbi:hypothetical protein Lal_00041793 [Lupinus albus]|nr:hypothetical protein Lal_00041793 [Lupinus albus]